MAPASLLKKFIDRVFFSMGAFCMRPRSSTTQFYHSFGFYSKWQGDYFKAAS